MVSYLVFTQDDLCRQVPQHHRENTFFLSGEGKVQMLLEAACASHALNLNPRSCGIILWLRCFIQMNL